MRRMTRSIVVVAAGMMMGWLGATAPGAQTRGGGPAAAEAPPERIDYLTFAQGAIPVSIGGMGVKFGANYERAVRSIDGDPNNFSVMFPAPADADVEFVYHLPALTTFDRLAVPNIFETPSPADTFVRRVEVYGSTSSAKDGWVLLGAADLQTHRARGLVTEIPVVAKQPVRWVRLRLAGGINVLRPTSSFEFSEIIGNGTQEASEPVTHFTGAWRTMANRMRLQQDGVLVSGCYDTSGVLTGTVTGNILRATGVSQSDKTPSAFILAVAEDGTIRGVRSSNNGPFRLYTLDVAQGDAGATCAQPSPPAIGCGSIIHGINFDFDSAVIRPESAAVLAELYEGLSADRSAKIVIEGHTSSEGTEEYNQRLSERRAQAVVDDLVRRGIVAARLSAAGIGERRPIATNNDESGRSLNRRVEVKCQ